MQTAIGTEGQRSCSCAGQKHPGDPFLTIEMNGNRLVQIHGYRNEGMHTSKGPFAPDPKETYHDWLESWVTWLKAGSKRKKDGTPILPKKKKKQAVGAA